jgi:membrane-associated phospholipid phosphatase
MSRIALWIALIGVACVLDAPIARQVRESGLPQLIRGNEPIRAALKFPGLYWTAVIAAGIVLIVHPLKRRAAALILLAPALSGLNWILKWVVGRTRPFKIDATGDRLAPFDFQPFVNGWHGLFNPPNLCFPSGHTCVAFATATALAMLWPRSRWRWIGFAVAGVVALERVAENAHWLSDVVAAAALGVGAAKLVGWTLSVQAKNAAAIPVTGDPGVQRAGEHPDAPGASRTGAVEALQPVRGDTD